MQREQPTQTTVSTESVVGVKRTYARAPKARSAGVSLRDVLWRWKVTTRHLYQLEVAGALIAIEVGNRVYYSEAQLRATFGGPQDDSGGAARAPSSVWGGPGAQPVYPL